MRTVLIGIAFLFAAGGAQATLGTSGFCRSFHTQVMMSNGACETSIVDPGSITPDIAIASGSSAYGTLKVYGFAGSTISAEAGASAMFSDTFTIASSTIGNGAQGFLTFGAAFENTSTHQLAPSGPSVSSTGVSYTVALTQANNSVSATGSQEIGLSSMPGGAGNYSNTVDLPGLTTFKFTFGVPITLRADLQSITYALYGAASTLDASHSAYWGGIASVTDLQGIPVVYSLVSSSGTDWSQSFIPSVPEPSTGLMLFVGAIAVWGTVRLKGSIARG